jgi:hypothetical protein
LQFTQGVVSAIRGAGGGLMESVDISVQGHLNAASLFHMAHADVHDVYLFGGNTVRRLPGGATMYRSYRDPAQVNEEVVRNMADALGFRLVRKKKG